jgi:hypothetical protein
MPLPASRWLALGALAASLVTSPARAWVESHQAGDDVRVTVDSNGVAHVEHTIPYRVKRGPLRSFDLTGVEKGIAPETAATITAEDGSELGAHVATLTDHVLRVTVEEPRKLLRGTFTFHVKYTIDLVAAKELTRDGSLWKLAWTAPIATEGFDGARIVFELPPGQAEPKVVHPETGAIDESVLATLTRGADHDELQIVRPHVARGEAVAWTLRLDPKAFGQVQAPELKEAPPPPPPQPPDETRDAALAGAIAAIAIAFALLVRTKGRAFAAECAARGAKARALLPVGDSWRAATAGALFAGGVALEVTGRPTIGAVLVGGALLAASLRSPDARIAARGPGKWLALRPEEAFVMPRAATHWLDVGGAAGKVALFVACAIVAALAFAVRRFGAEAPYLVLLDAVALVPLFATGRAAQLPPSLAHAPSRTLRGIFARLQKREAMRTVPWARVPIGQTEPDELRILSLPRVAMPGLLAIEVGVAYGQTTTGYAAATEVLVRVQEGSAASARMATLAPAVRTVPGRRADERVVRLEPRVPTSRGAIALVERLGRELVDRRLRLATDDWRGSERRVARNTPKRAAA